MQNDRSQNRLSLHLAFFTVAFVLFSASILATTPATADTDCGAAIDTDDSEHIEQWCAKDGGHHGEDDPGSGSGARPGPGPTDSTSTTPTTHYITRPVESGVAYNCVTTTSGQSCTPDVNSCVTNASYTVDNNDTIAVPQASPQQPDEEMVMVAIIRVDPEADTEEHVAFDCRPVSEANSTSETEPVVITVTQRDFASMPVEPLEASAGPPEGWLPVNMRNVLYADPEEQVLQTELLDTPVSVRATPVSYHWDLGDGNTITTDSPGQPYPSDEISTSYTQEGWYDITLTTTFSGEFSVDGDPWQDIDGTIEVASDPIPLYSKSLESRLVNTDVPIDEDEDPWIPPRTPETEGPMDRNATDQEL